MKNRIKDAFDDIRAEEPLKDRTREFLSAKMQSQMQKAQNIKARNQMETAQTIQARKRRQYGKWIAAAAGFCFMVMIFAGYQFYFSATAVISIDVNPSIELNINRFDTVISVKAYNEDGQDLAENLDVRFMKYGEAVQAIMDSDAFAGYRSEDDVVSVAVAGYDEKQQEKILTDMEFCAAAEKNMYCYYADGDEIAKAHEAGLSCGKYRAYLELQKLDPDVTVEEVRKMTMREIRERIEELSPDPDDSSGNTAQEEGAGQRNGTGQRNGAGQSGKGHMHRRHKGAE